MYALILLTAAWAAPPQVVDVTRVDHVVADDRGVSAPVSDTVFHLVLQDRGQSVDVSCRTTTPPGPTCEAALPGGRARTLRVASLHANTADRFVQQPAVWIGDVRMVGRLAAEDLGQALAHEDLRAGGRWTATALVGQSLGDGDGRPLFPPDEAFKGGATDVQSDLLAAWRCAALEGGPLFGALRGAPASAIQWMADAQGACDCYEWHWAHDELCVAWGAAPATAAWCGSASRRAPKGVVPGGEGDGGLMSALPALPLVPANEIRWKQQAPVAVSAGLGAAAASRCVAAIELDTRGVPTKVTVAECPRPYADAVEEAVRRWRAFRFKVDGKAIPVRTSVHVEIYSPKAIP